MDKSNIARKYPLSKNIPSRKNEESALQNVTPVPEHEAAKIRRVDKIHPITKSAT